jgi:hypothetical protein
MLPVQNISANVEGGTSMAIGLALLLSGEQPRCKIKVFRTMEEVSIEF